MRLHGTAELITCHRRPGAAALDELAQVVRAPHFDQSRSATITSARRGGGCTPSDTYRTPLPSDFDEGIQKSMPHPKAAPRRKGHWFGWPLHVRPQAPPGHRASRRRVARGLCRRTLQEASALITWRVAEQLAIRLAEMRRGVKTRCRRDLHDGLAGVHEQLPGPTQTHRFM